MKILRIFGILLMLLLSYGVAKIGGVAMLILGLFFGFKWGNEK